MDAKNASGQPEAHKPPELLEPEASRCILLPITRTILLSLVIFFLGICPWKAFQLSSGECQSFSRLAREMTFEFSVLCLLFSCFMLNLTFLSGSSPLSREVSVGWWLFQGIQQYPQGVSYGGEITGIVGRGGRDLCSQLGMGAAPKEVGYTDDFEDVQSGEEDKRNSTRAFQTGRK